MKRCCVMFAVLAMVSGAQALEFGHWRGPSMNGVFESRDLPETWSPDGTNLKWTAAVGSRSAPVVMNGHVYLINRVGEGESLHRVQDLLIGSEPVGSGGNVGRVYEFVSSVWGFWIPRNHEEMRCSKLARRVV